MNKLRILNESEVSFFDKAGEEVKLMIKKIDTDVLIYKGEEYEVEPGQLKVMKKICLENLEIELDKEVAEGLEAYVTRKYNS